MKIIIKNKKDEYIIETDSNLITVKEFKILFKNKYGLNLDDLKLIYNGKFLQNNKTLECYNIKDKSKLITSGKFKTSINKSNSQLILSEEKNDSSFLFQSSNSLNPISEITISETNNNNNEEINNSFSGNNLKNSKNADINENKSNLPNELKNIAIYMKIMTLKEENKMNEILNNLKENNPALLNQIIENKDEFMKYLSKPITSDNLENFKNNISSLRELLSKSSEDKKEKIKICLTQKDTEDINKLKKKGYQFDDIIYAYLINDTEYDKTEKYLINQKNNKNEE